MHRQPVDVGGFLASIALEEPTSIRIDDGTAKLFVGMEGTEDVDPRAAMFKR